MLPVQVLSLHPSAGYYTQQNLVTVKGLNFLPEPLLEVRLLSQTLQDEYYSWQWDSISYVDSETLVVRMPSMQQLLVADYSDVIF